MKKLILTLSFAAGCLLNSQAASTPEFQWASYIKGEASMTATPGVIKQNGNKELFVLGNFGSRIGTGTKANYTWSQSNGTLTTITSLESGAPYTGTANNSNPYLYKLNKNGELQWQVTGNMGNIYLSGSTFTPTKDGGVFLALKMQHTNKNENNNNILLGLVGATGQTTNVICEYPDRWAYMGVFAKIAANGTVAWTKLIPVNNDSIKVDGVNTAFNDALNFNDITEDENGNLYLGGTYSREITFPTTSSEGKILVPHNTENWDGTSSVTDLFVVKLDENGNYLWDLVTSGKIVSESVKSISYANGYLYLLGNLKGNGQNEIVLGSFNMEPTAKTDAFVAKISTSDASVAWSTHFKALLNTSSKGGNIKISTINATDENVFICGSFTGIIGNANGDNLLENTSNSGGTLNGFTLKLNAGTGAYNTGAWFNFASTGLPATTIGEIAQTFYKNNALYAVGHGMSTAAGVCYYKLDANLSNISEPFYVIKSTGSPTSFSATLVDNVLVSFGRSNANASFPGTSITTTYSAYSSTLSAYSIPDIHTTISAPEQVDGFKVYASGPSQLTIESDTDKDLSIYDMSGRLAARKSVSAGVAAYVKLNQGLYIVNGKKIIIR